MTPLERYQSDLRKEKFQHDRAQDQAVQHMQRVFDDLLTQPPAKPPTLLSRLINKSKVHTIKGVYLWGGVGRGKTYLVDCFYDCLPFREKKRIHFQRFMHDVHNELKILPKAPDPLHIVARRFAESMRVLCLDEFHVDDVADAMLLAGLLKSLIDHNVTLVFTSNIPPDELYRHGLQRERFLPAIDLIKGRTKEVHLDGDTDYRLGILEESVTFFSPLNEESERALREFLIQEIDGNATYDKPIIVNERAIKTVATGDGIIWCEFAELCATARSANDYLWLCEHFDTVMISNIFVMNETSDDVANRFIQLIDALYDHKTRLIASAQCPVDHLYTGERKNFEFQRTTSRLREMFSLRYDTTARQP